MNQADRDNKLSTAVNDIQWIKLNMVTKAEFDPVKKVVYGAVGLILTFVLMALLALVIVKASRP